MNDISRVNVDNEDLLQLFQQIKEVLSILWINYSRT